MRQLKKFDVVTYTSTQSRVILLILKVLNKKAGAYCTYLVTDLLTDEQREINHFDDLVMRNTQIVTRYKKQGRNKQVKLLSGLMGTQHTLQANYGDFAEFYQYDQAYNLSSKLGFADPVTAWNINSVIQQGTDPDDYTTLAARIVKCYDNSETENATADCYTCINTKTGDGLSCSHNPFHPAGIGSNFNLVDSIMFHEWGAGWRTSLKSRVNRIIREKVKGYIKEAENNPGWLGKEIQYRDLPDKVKEYLHSSFEI